MAGLHRCDHAELLIERKLIRRDNLIMFDPQAKVFWSRRGRRGISLWTALGSRKSIEGHLCGAVSNGVKSELKPGRHPLGRHAIQFGLLILRQSRVARII